jgi:hypothetical protein
MYRAVSDQISHGVFRPMGSAIFACPADIDVGAGIEERFKHAG